MLLFKSIFTGSVLYVSINATEIRELSIKDKRVPFGGLSDDRRKDGSKHIVRLQI